MSPRKVEVDPLEAIGFLVQCPTCLVAKGAICVVVHSPVEGNNGKPADAMHRPRIAMGRKWQDWHRGIT